MCACDLSHSVAPRVAGVAVGGENLNCERIPLAEGQFRGVTSGYVDYHPKLGDDPESP